MTEIDFALLLSLLFPLLDCLKSIGHAEADTGESSDATMASNNPKAAEPAVASTSTSSGSSSTPEPVVYKVHLPNRSYKSVRTTVNDTAEMMLESLCEKLNLKSDCAKYMVLFERVKDRERRVKGTEMISDIVKMWPKILGETGNETGKYCYFLAAPLSTAPEHIIQAMS